ncbi:MAG: tetratricopeptide repeat protein [Spirochaetia bacterium]|nr:tetratricopeptide repeat protein [Spirochaetia bacterium]
MISAEKKQVIDLYNEGLNLYKDRKWRDALQKFESAIQLIPDDGPSKLYIERCQLFIENPPPADWDGVFTMTTK